MPAAVSPAPVAIPPDAVPDVLVLATGETVGRLEPCLCNLDQPGGITRRPTALKHLIPPHGRAIIADNGDLTTGFGPLAQLKFDVVLDAMVLMNYDAWNLGETDLFLGADRLAAALARQPGVKALSANVSHPALKDVVGPYLIKRFTVDGRAVRFAVVGILSREFADQVKAVDKAYVIRPPAEVLKELLPKIRGEADVVVLLAHAPKDEGLALMKEFGSSLDTAITGHGTDHAMTTSHPYQARVTMSAPAEAEEICNLGYSFMDGELKSLSAGTFPVSADLDKAPEAVELFEQYQASLRKANLVANAPRRELPEGQSYVGSSACRSCHQPQHLVWRDSKHAHAYETLKDEKRHYDPECVKCHVVGMDTATGFTSFIKSRDLAGVGCESCHGPGGRHVTWCKANPGIAPPEGSPERMPRGDREGCVRCHTTDQSPRFKLDTYLPKIEHWEKN